MATVLELSTIAILYLAKWKPIVVDYRWIEQFTSQFCWASDPISNATATSCADISTGNVFLGPDVQDPRRAVDYLPKFIVLVGVLFLIPHYQWEYYAAGTLKVTLTLKTWLFTQPTSRDSRVIRSGKDLINIFSAVPSLYRFSSGPALVRGSQLKTQLNHILGIHWTFTKSYSNHQSEMWKSSIVWISWWQTYKN